ASSRSCDARCGPELGVQRNLQFIRELLRIKRAASEVAAVYFDSGNFAAAFIDPEDEVLGIGVFVDVNFLVANAAFGQKLLGAPTIRAPTGGIEANRFHLRSLSLGGPALDVSRSLEAGAGAGHRFEHCIPIGVDVCTGCRELLLGFDQIGAGAGHVNLLGTFGCLGEDGYSFWKHFGKSTHDCDVSRLRVFLIDQRPNSQLGKQRSMAREYSEVTRKARELDLGDGFANDFAFRRYHLETESI